MSTEDRIAALKVQLAQARAERDQERATAEAAEADARRTREAEARARHEQLLGQMRNISGEFARQIDEGRGGRARMEDMELARTKRYIEEGERVAELSRRMGALKESFREVEEQRQAAEERMKKEIYEDLSRRHEEIRGLVSARVSIRESASLDEEMEEDAEFAE
ncbi:hypothetical protein K488DRAFT_85828 [Vararia minispora EC-137]|uniref:Uncharacterized protein n=1 Tax=Vararia minispora EC-137 TaxID=1314806 RepID=A0ACB8QM54_9AGAM|nr:hypothetical protein K488DRAFT_85828 [Vararia minispora EC-137]